MNALAEAQSHLQAGRLDEAERLLRRVLRRAPEEAAAAHLLGIVLHRAGRDAQALTFLDRARRAGPADARLAGNRASVLAALGRHDDALAELDDAVARHPGEAALHYNRGNALLARGRNEAAEEAFERALARHPDLVPAWQNIGLARTRQGKLEAALAAYERVIALAPPARPGSEEARLLAEMWANKAWALDWLNRREEALAACQTALAIVPDFPLAHWNAAPILLALGDYARGWREWEWRWQLPDSPLRRRALSAPLWLGAESLAGRTILLHAEQGFGDTLQFCRFARRVQARGARTILEVPRPLLALARTLPGVDTLIAAGETLPPFDCHTPLMSLPLALGITLNGLAGDVPYLAADPARIASWRARLGESGRRRVAFAWSGNPGTPTDRWRSAPLAALAVLFRKDIEFVCLQREIREADREAVHRFGIRFFGEAIADFADTAALIALSDLCLTTDTGPAHLAGAMGHKLWVMLHDAPEWRWLIGREDSPWYPSARLFRQTRAGDWGELAARVAAAL